MKKRLIWADALKGLLMILVVIGHAIQTVEQDACEINHLWNIIYSFHMPAFMAVSGWLAYRGQSLGGAFIKRRFRQLMIPYFIWSLIMFLLIENKNFTKIFLYPDNFFWFLWALFFISVLFIANQMFSKRIHIDEMLIHLAVCCVLSGIMVLLNLRLFGFQFIAYYFLFYLLGYTIRRYDLTRYVNGMAATTLFLIWGVLAWFWNMHELPLGLKEIFCYPETIMLFIYRIITAFIAIIILLKVCPLLMSNSNSMVLSILVSFGKLSLGIYTTHLLFADIIKDNDIVLPNVIISEVLLSFLLVLASYGLVRLISSNTILSRWMLGKV